MAADYKCLTVKEVSKVLHVHPSTIYKLPKVARFQLRIGSDWRFRTDAIERWMAEQSKDVPQ